MKRKQVPLYLLAIAMSITSAFAAEVNLSTANLAVQNWLKRSPKPMNCHFKGWSVVQTKTARNAAEKPLFHVVELDGGGFVVTSGDTRIKPVIAFSDSDTFSWDKSNPLFALLSCDMSNRLESLGLNQPVTAKMNQAGKSLTSVGPSSYEAEWAELTAIGKDEDGRSGRLYYASEGPLDDVRVEPLVRSAWSQMDIDGEYVFNYYTPSHYECGCVVSAFAQVMRKWEYPASASVGTYRCWVDGTAEEISMLGGEYDWSSMPYLEEDCTTEAQRKAIGKLTYDLGVASQMQWNKTGSGASPLVTSEALRNRFGYASCSTYAGDMTSNIGASLDYRNAILSSLDAGMPAVIGVSKQYDNSGHEIVVDGYGFDGDAAIYCHLNCGWSGIQNMWYNLIGEAVTEWYAYTCVDNVAYNIHPTKAGEVISGRVMSGNGTPVAGAVVSLSDMNGKKLSEKTTNDKGIYSFRVTGANRYLISAKSGGISSNVRTVALYVKSRNATHFIMDNGVISPYYGESHGIVANKWGVDVVLYDGKAVSISLYPNGGEGYVETISFAANTVQCLPECTFERPGYEFEGWAVSASGPCVYTDGQIASFANNANLYAKWKKLTDRFTVRYNANGGTGQMKSDVCDNSSGLKLSSNAFVRPGYAFLGWALEPNGKMNFCNKYTAYYSDLAQNWDELPSNTGKVFDLYAVWGKTDGYGLAIQDGELLGWDGSGSSDIDVPEGVTQIGAAAFRGTGITSIRIASSVEQIGYCAFDDCNLLTNVTFISGHKQIDIDVGAFTDCPNLYDVFELPEGLVELRRGIFNGTHVTDIVLPKTLAKVNEQLLFYNDSLKKVWYKGNAPEYDSGVDYPFPQYRQEVSPYYSASAELVSYVAAGSTGWKDGTSALPDVWPVYSWAQGDAETTADACRTIRNYTGTPPKGTAGVVVDYREPAFTIEGGVLKKAELYGATSVTIPDGVTSIADYVFFEGTGIKQVRIPDSVKTIGIKAFKKCSNLSYVRLPAGLTKLGQAAFQDCTSLTEVDVPAGIDYLWSSTFEGCTALRRASLPESITAIGTSAFANCKALEEVNIPSTVKSIKSFAFFSCESLPAVTLPKKLVTIEQKAFKNCVSLPAIEIPSSVTKLGKGAFFNSGLVEATVPGSVSKVDDYCFQKCAALKKMTLMKGVTTTGSSVWANDEALKEVVFPKSLETLGGYAFFRCYNLATLWNFSNMSALSTLGEKTFKHCTSLKSLTVPSQVTTLPKEMCNYCAALETVNGTANVTSIGQSAFSNCLSLESVAGLNAAALKTVKAGKAWAK